MPDQWTRLLKGSAITAEDAAKNPQAVLDVLEFYAEQTKREEEEYGTSQLQGAVERMSGVGWAKMMQENSLHQPPQTPTASTSSSSSSSSTIQKKPVPNVKLPPKNIPTRPAPPPPSALAALSELKIQVSFSLVRKDSLSNKYNRTNNNNKNYSKSNSSSSNRHCPGRRIRPTM